MRTCEETLEDIWAILDTALTNEVKASIIYDMLTKYNASVAPPKTDTYSGGGYRCSDSKWVWE